MKKIISLIRACMTDNMSIFKIRVKNEKSKKIVPIILAFVLMAAMWSYSEMIIEPLVDVHAEHVLLTLFVTGVIILTFVEGIYKSGNLLFNCKDDNLLLSLPIKKRTVVFIRILKFYVFELLYNTVFLLPSMLVYARHVQVDGTYYLVSLVALLLLPIIPIAISCVFGMIITVFSSRFKHKNFAQIAVTTIILLGVFYLSFNLESIIGSIAKNANSINSIITKIYYPINSYINLVLNFNIKDLLLFIGINLLVLAITIGALSKIYFKINSSAKAVKTTNKNTHYKIKTNSPLDTLIKKELSRFISTPVFIINAGFGLVLFVVGCIAACFKFDSIIYGFASPDTGISIDQIRNYLPVILFGWVLLSSFMTSITSSMISLEGKSFGILKSLPVTPQKIILSKVLTAVLIMIPLILIGDLAIFTRFGFSLLEVLIIIIASILFPLISETIGIIVNLKFPKMDAANDTEVVKQSTSSMISVFAGMFLGFGSISLFTFMASKSIPGVLIMIYALIAYLILGLCLLLLIIKKGTKYFNQIQY